MHPARLKLIILRSISFLESYKSYKRLEQCRADLRIARRKKYDKMSVQQTQGGNIKWLKQ
jgi:hypothetical protein